LLNCVGGGLLPRFAAGADQFNDFVDAVGHVVLPFGIEAGSGYFLPRSNLASRHPCSKALSIRQGHELKASVRAKTFQRERLLLT
jgi:hypothetical protein